MRETTTLVEGHILARLFQCDPQTSCRQVSVVLSRVSALVILLTCLTNLANADLIGHWEFDEGSGMTAEDSTTGSHDGTINGATYVPGKVGSNALNFDGLDDFVQIGVVPALDLTGGSYTLAWWHKWDGAKPGPFPFPPEDFSQRIINMDDGNGHDGGYSITLEKLTSRVTMTHNNGTNNNLNTGIAVPVGIWQHMAVTFDSSTSVRRLYVDGDLASTDTISGGSLTSDSNDPLLFGAIDNTPGFGGSPPGVKQFFLGSLDDIRIYDEPLSAAQVRSLVPEPSTIALAALALLGLIAFGRRRHR